MKDSERTCSTNLGCPSPSVCERKVPSLPFMTRSSKAVTVAGTESGPIRLETLPNFGGPPGGAAAAGLGFTFEGARIVDAGRAGLLSGKVMAPPDWATAISSSREVAASNLSSL